MASGKYEIIAEEGIERSFEIALKNHDDTPVNLSNSTLRLYIKEHFNDCEPIKIVQLNITDAVGGLAQVLIPSDTFVGRLKSTSHAYSKNYVYEIVETSLEKNEAWLSGIIKVYPRVGDYE